MSTGNDVQMEILLCAIILYDRQPKVNKSPLGVHDPKGTNYICLQKNCRVTTQ